MPDAVVDVAGDARALGQGRGARLVLPGLLQAGARGPQRHDLLVQIVPHGVQALARRLLLGGAQGQAGRQERHDRARHRTPRARGAPGPHHRDHRQRGAADREQAGPPGTEGPLAHQVVDDQRRAHR